MLSTSDRHLKYKYRSTFSGPKSADHFSLPDDFCGIAFKQNIWWGIALLIIPFVIFAFAVTYWGEKITPPFLSPVSWGDAHSLQ